MSKPVPKIYFTHVVHYKVKCQTTNIIYQNGFLDNLNSNKLNKKSPPLHSTPLKKQLLILNNFQLQFIKTKQNKVQQQDSEVVELHIAVIDYVKMFLTDKATRCLSLRVAS